MNTPWVHKIQIYEVQPPEKVWDLINAELADLHLADQFPSRLYQAEVAPAPAVWTSIVQALDLAEPAKSVSQTLYNLEATPPTATWNKIATMLDQDEVEVVFPKRRSFPLIRYASAAAILAAVILGAMQLTGDSNSRTEIALDEKIKNSGSDHPAHESVKVAPATPSGPIISGSTDTNDAALEASKKTLARLDANDYKKIRRVNAAFFESPANPIIVAANFDPVHTYENLECTDVATPSLSSGTSPIDVASRYAMLMTPDGNIIRISKKLGELVCCVSGVDQDDQCVDQMRKWQRKIANSPVAPSPGNFMDIMDLLQTLKDNSL